MPLVGLLSVNVAFFDNTHVFCKCLHVAHTSVHIVCMSYTVYTMTSYPYTVKCFQQLIVISNTVNSIIIST